MNGKSDCIYLCTCFVIDKKKYAKTKLFEKINDILIKEEKRFGIKLNINKQKKETTNYFSPIGKPFKGYVCEDPKDITLSLRWIKKRNFKINESKMILNKYLFLKEIFDLLEKNNIKSEGYICTTFKIDATKFTNSFIDLPIKFPIPNKGKNNLGMPNVYGLKFQFEDSKIGLERLSITELEKMLVIDVKYKYYTNQYSNILKNNYNQANKIINLFIKRK